MDSLLKALVFCPTPLGIFEQSLALQERGLLGTMALDYYCDMQKAPYRWLPNSRITRYLKRRYVPALDSSHVRSHILPAVAARISHRIRRGSQATDEAVFRVNAQFDRWVARHLEEFGNLAFGYESSSLFTFRRAQALGIPRVLYQPIACAEKAVEILDEEARRFPHLAETLRYNWFPETELARRREERQLAQAVLCASTFTKQSLVDVGVPAEKIYVEPYGVDQELFQPSQDKFDKFSVIWASSSTQTKGFAYLLEALARKPVPNIELVQTGYPRGFEPATLYGDRIQVRRLGYVTREQLAAAMARCHVHVFPTLLDGFGRNLIEAMASGLPVITTTHCAGPDLIEDGVTGFIVPIRDVDAICDRLAWLYAHPAEAAEMGRRARDSVKHLTKPDYRRRFADRISSLWQSLASNP